MGTKFLTLTTKSCFYAIFFSLFRLWYNYHIIPIIPSSLWTVFRTYTKILYHRIQILVFYTPTTVTHTTPNYSGAVATGHLFNNMQYHIYYTTAIDHNKCNRNICCDRDGCWTSVTLYIPTDCALYTAILSLSKHRTLLPSPSPKLKKSSMRPWYLRTLYDLS